MIKLSKKDTTPEQEQAEQEAFEKFSQVKSEHFAVGTWILYKNERYEIIGRLADILTVVGEDSIPMFLSPYALRR